MSKKWIISDLHFGHDNIVKFSRDYREGNNAEEHDEWLINQINSVVKKHDLLYILGDVAFCKKSLEKVKKIKAGNRILIRGNHDLEPTQEYLKYFSQVYGLLSVKGAFWLSHAPIHPQELRGRFNIHGHVHQNSVRKEDGTLDEKYINACVEMTRGVPQSLDDLLAMEKYKPIVDEYKRLKKENRNENI